MRTPPNFKKKDPTRMKEGKLIINVPSNMADAPKQKQDWQGKLKNWKQMQTSKGSITSFTEMKEEVWKSGITSIMALLQSPIESDSIRKQVE